MHDGHTYKCYTSWTWYRKFDLSNDFEWRASIRISDFRATSIIRTRKKRTNKKKVQHSNEEVSKINRRYTVCEFISNISAHPPPSQQNSVLSTPKREIEEIHFSV